MKEVGSEMPLVDIESNNETTSHWNPFSPYYKSNELNFVANTNDITDDDFASLRDSEVTVPPVGSNIVYHHADVEHYQPNAGYQQTNADYHHQPYLGQAPTSEFHQGGSTDMFGSTTFGSQVPEFQQGLKTSSENLNIVDASRGFRDGNTVDPHQIVQDGNNPFLQGYRTSEVEKQLNLADQLSSDSEAEEGELPENSGFDPPLSPGLSDPFGAAPFVVQNSKQALPPSKDAFGASPFAAPPETQTKGNEKQLNDAQRSQQVPDSFSLPSSFSNAPAGSSVENVSGFVASSPFHEGDEGLGNSTPFVVNAGREDPSGLVNPAADFIDNTDDPFGGVSFNANPAVRRRNAKKQQPLKKEPPMAAPRGDNQGPRPRPRRLLPQTPNKAPGQRMASGQPIVQGVRVVPGSTQGPGNSDSKRTGNRSAYAAT